jgi:hypothetical protein
MPIPPNRKMLILSARIVAAALMVVAAGSGAFGQSCLGIIDNCEWECPIVPDPASEGSGFTIFMKEPGCMASCAALCNAGPAPLTCNARDRCETACPLVEDPQSQPDFRTLIHDPACMAECGKIC